MTKANIIYGSVIGVLTLVIILGGFYFLIDTRLDILEVNQQQIIQFINANIQKNAPTEPVK